MRRLAALLVATTAIFGASLVNTGCGTVLGHHGMQDLDVRLAPADHPAASSATIRVNGRDAGKGPGKYQIDSRRESNSVEVVDANNTIIGRGTVTREVHTGVVIADAFMLIFPIYIDYANGGLYRMVKDIQINLARPAGPEPEPPPVDKQPPAPTAKPETKPCSTCGEPRPVSAETCPHCGLK